jgi:hypothetical protein
VPSAYCLRMSTSNPELHFEALHHRVRPARTLTAIGADDSWSSDAIRMIEFHSQQWGGVTSTIAPASWDWVIPEKLWPLLSEFDADYWSHFQRNTLSLEMRGSEHLGSFLTEFVDQFRGTTSQSDDDLREEALITHQRVPSWVWPPALPAHNRILLSTAPYGTPEAMAISRYEIGRNPPNRFVEITSLAGCARTVYHLECEEIPELVQLLVYATSGRFRPDFQRRFLKLSDAQITHLFIDSDEIANLLRYAWGSAASIHPNKVEVEVSAGRVSAQVENYSAQSIRENCPFGLTTLGNLSYFTSTTSADNPIVIICGDTAEDFCYAYTRQRVTQTTHWLPLSNFDDTSQLHLLMLEVMAEVLYEASDTPNELKRIVLTSCSVDVEELELISRSLNDLILAMPEVAYPIKVLTVDVVDVDDVPVTRDAYILDKENFDVILYEPFVGETMVKPATVLVPSIGPPDGCRWQVDIESDSCMVPAMLALNPLLSALGESHSNFSVRASKSGISIDSHGASYVFSGMTFSQSLVKVRLRFPPVEEIFREMFSRMGLTIKSSDKGNFNRRLVELWGDLQSAAEDLRSPIWGTLFTKWVDTKKSDVLPGIIVDQRRCLTFSDAVRSTKLHVDAVRDVLDSYLLRGIISRGLVLSCRRCENTSFYRVADISETFECRRCRQVTAISRVNWQGAREPIWFYALDEVVYQALDKNGAVPILALATLAKGYRSFQWMPEQMLVGGKGNPMEIDILAIRNGILILGEAKSTNRIDMTDKRLEKLGRIVSGIGAKRFVMATSHDDWTSDSRARIVKCIAPSAPVEWLSRLRPGN